MIYRKLAWYLWSLGLYISGNLLKPTIQLHTYVHLCTNTVLSVKLTYYIRLMLSRYLVITGGALMQKYSLFTHFQISWSILREHVLKVQCTRNIDNGPWEKSKHLVHTVHILCGQNCKKRMFHTWFVNLNGIMLYNHLKLGC